MKMEVEKYELIYKIDKNSKELRLLGKSFFQKNKLNGYFIYNNKKIKLIDIIGTKNIQENEIKIDLVFYNKIYNKSFMFKDCISLLKFSEINTENNDDKNTEITNNSEEENLIDDYFEHLPSDNTLMENLEDIESLVIYSPISSLKKNDTNTSTILKIYKHFKEIPNASNKSMYFTGMFSNCTSLISLSGLSNWNMEDAMDISGMFFNCKSLINLPDISN